MPLRTPCRPPLSGSPFRCAGTLAAACLLAAAAASAQPATRVAATTLRIPAAPPATSYTTVRAFPTLAFTQPLALVSPPGDPHRLFVVEKGGRIWVIPDTTAAAPERVLFLDLSARVATGGGTDERGLLALGFHPEFAANRQFYVWYTLNTTSPAGGGLHNRLARFLASATAPHAADPASESPLLTQRDEAANHNGGQILFGPDGYLYLSLGDEGGANDQYQNSQRLDRDYFAGVIRIDVDRRPGSLAPHPHPAVHAGAYAVPPDNPWVGATSFNGAAVDPAAVRTEFWAVGLRNPWRMAFDPATGQLWLGDVGQNAREEIDVIVRGGNYGWSYREGAIPGPRANPPAAAAATFLPPIWDYPNPAQGQSVTGGFVYRGSRYADLVGHYLFADFVSGRIWALRPEGTNPVGADRVRQIAGDGGIASFGLDPATGDILLADLSENAIKRLVAAPAGGDALPATLGATGAFADLATLAPAPGVVAYEPNVSFWSDHARKRRWFALRDTTSTFGFSADGNWALPAGAVWIKHFDLDLTRGQPATARRLETRFLVKTADGVFGFTYRWNDAQTDATLVPDEGAEQTFAVVEDGAARPQAWRFPSRAECLTCHTAAGGHALSFNTRQLNNPHRFPGDPANQLVALAAAGYFAPGAPSFAPSTRTDVLNQLPRLAPAGDTSASLERRARSYLDANCASCHQPGGPALGYFDARYATPLTFTGLVNGPLIDHGGDPANRVIVPGDPAHSRALQRAGLRGPGQMPPLASRERDLAGEALLRAWIAALAEPVAAQPPSRLVNLAARAQTGAGDNVLIPGFVIGPGPDKTVLVRAVGPTLSSPPFNLPGMLADPVLTLLGPNSATRIAASNDNWAATDRTVFDQAGAFPLPDGSRDAALVARLAPGAYTAQVSPAAGSGATGLALVEVYDAERATSPTGVSRLVNLSVRAQVGTGDGVLIPGIVVGPGAAKTVLIRAIGPTLGDAPFGVAGVLAQPVLTLFQLSRAVATNTAWGTAPNAAEIRATARAVGAFALPENSRDSALLVTLPPEAYTLQVTGANGTTGVALVEVYEVP